MPTTIIDGNIKVVGIPDFPWIYGDDLYKKLKSEYLLKKDWLAIPWQLGEVKKQTNQL